LRRVAPGFYDSGFRVKPGMTKGWGARRAWGLASLGGGCGGVACNASTGVGNPYGVGGCGVAFPRLKPGVIFGDVPTGHFWFRRAWGKGTGGE
jgi:hypothetical protein